MRITSRFTAPENLSPQQRDNFYNVQMEALGVGVEVATVPFLPVFLTRLGATSSQVGLLTSVPALAALLLTIPVGRFLQGRRNIRPWYSVARLVTTSSYALIGLLPVLVSRQAIVPAVLWIRIAISLPQTIFVVAFSVLMSAVAGPQGLFELMSRRWSIAVFTTAVSSAIASQALARIPFPLNYQVVFLALSSGGLIVYYYSSRLKVDDMEPVPQSAGLPWSERFTHFVELVRGQRAFLSFVGKRFVYHMGLILTVPLLPLYYVRVVQASDAWIGIFSTAQTATMLVGFALWKRLSETRGSRFVLLSTTLVVSLYPALVASSGRALHMALYAALAGIFLSGLDLVLFDELMKTVPLPYSPTFVAMAQGLQQTSNIAAPLLGTVLADRIGLGGALVASAALRLAGFLLFARGSDG